MKSVTRKIKAEYWKDDNDNIWEKDLYSEEEAVACSESLVNCHFCINCNGMKDSSNCRDCADMINCKDCSYCSACKDCSACNRCNDCENCFGCDDCSYCIGVSGLKDYEGDSRDD